MVPTMRKQVVLWAVFAAGMLGTPGCMKQFEYDAKKVAELRRQAERSVLLEKRVSQLRNDLDAAKAEVEKAKRANKDLEARIRRLEQGNGDLQDRLKKPAPNAERVAQLQKDLDAAKADIERTKTELEKAKAESDAAKRETEKAEQAKNEVEARIKSLERPNAAWTSRARSVSVPIVNLSGNWQITFRNNDYAAALEALGGNNYRLGPKNLAFSGIYRFDGTNLSMIAENPRYPDLVWSMRNAGLLEMAGSNFAGASMTRRTASSSDADR
jgi:hypothetical protein